jgi:hypothetical protein
VQEIHSFSLGLSYSLSNEDVFSFLGELTCLESLQLRYYPVHVGPLFLSIFLLTVRHISAIQTSEGHACIPRPASFQCHIPIHRYMYARGRQQVVYLDTACDNIVPSHRPRRYRLRRAGEYQDRCEYRLRQSHISLRKQARRYAAIPPHAAMLCPHRGPTLPMSDLP